MTLLHLIKMANEDITVNIRIVNSFNGLIIEIHLMTQIFATHISRKLHQDGTIQEIGSLSA